MARNKIAGNSRMANGRRGRFGVAVSVGTPVTALVVGSPGAPFAQSPLTVQLSTGRAGVGNTNPSEARDVIGTVNATSFSGDGSRLTKLVLED